MKKQGFTLAEVLITLVIIGIIAAMTLPSLLGGTNKQEIKTGLQKSISVLTQAITLQYALTGDDFSTLSSGSTTTVDAFAKSRLNLKKIDVTQMLVWFVENYPESKRIMKENPDYQMRFK